MENNVLFKVTGCINCPFAVLDQDESNEFAQYICSEISRQNIDWANDEGFHELYELGITPNACPLKKGKIIISN